MLLQFRRLSFSDKGNGNALEYQPKHQIAHLNLGIVNLTAGNLQKSKEWFQKAVQLNPNSDIGKRAQELLTTH